MDRKNKLYRKIVKLMSFPPITLIVIAFAFVLVKGAWGMYEKSSFTQDKIARLEEKREDLTKREKYLTAKINNLENPKGEEEMIRESFGLSLPNEDIVMIPDINQELINRSSTTISVSWWDKVKSLFIK